MLRKWFLKRKLLIIATVVLIILAMYLIHSYVFHSNDEFIPIVYADTRQAYTCFALELLKRIDFSHRNTVVSPLSIYIALLMLTEGSAGNTRSELLNALHLRDLDDARTWFKQVLSNIIVNTSLAIVDIGNSVWVREGFNVNESYITLLKKYYLAENYTFNSPDDAVDQINKWVSEKTRGLIDRVLDYGDINAYTVLLLINTLYFKANWSGAFKEEIESSFYAPKARVETTFLAGKVYAYYIDTRDYVVVGLGYKGTKIKFVVIMPKNGDVDNLINSIGYGGLLEIFDQLFNSKPQRIKLYMPKFDIDSGKLLLNNVLKDMGIREVFDPGKADLRYMTATEEYSPGSLFVDKIYHRARIKVTLTGTEAAAATSIAIVLSAVIEDLPVVKINKPFLFFLVDPDTNAILFAGSYISP